MMYLICLGNMQELNPTCMQEICVSCHLSHMVHAYDKPSIPYTANVDNIQPGLHHSRHKEWYKIYDLFHTIQYSYRTAPSHLTILNLSLSPLEDTNHISNACKQLATVTIFPFSICNKNVELLTN